MGREVIAIVFAMSALIACSGDLAPGEPCFESSECGAAECIETSIGRRCMLTCAAEDVLCDANEACVAASDDSELFVCLPGGETTLGSACSESVECVVGAICVNNGEIACAKLCSTSLGTSCGAGEQCIITSGDRGFCGLAP